MRATVAALLCSLASPALAGEVVRYAVIVGENHGAPSEEVLRYAQTDADRLREVLIDVGQFLPENVALLHDTSADSFRATLIRMNDRLRTSASPALLVVFYSGHADAAALHLGESTLPLEQLEALVRGSAADFRLLIVDACRSGALTRAKGGSPVPKPLVELGERLPADGVVFWTSSSADEDAQESDDIKGSFFSHYLVSALLGAADDNHDGAISLAEAYQYASTNTVRASSKTLAGIQHATFRYETHGLSDVALTWLEARDRAQLTLPSGRDYLFFQNNAEGSVVAEVGARQAERRISLRPGRYFVRARGVDHLLEGTVTLAAGTPQPLDERRLERVEYSRLVRKGLGARTHALGLELGYTLRPSFWDNGTACQGLVAGGVFDLPAVSLALRGFGCRGAFTNSFLAATTDELGLELRVTHAWDLGRVSLSAGGLAGGSALIQTFHAEGTAPTRLSPSGHLGLTASVSVELVAGLSLTTEVDALTHLFPQAGSEGVTGHAALSVRGSLLVGKRW
jgi:Caspase domain